MVDNHSPFRLVMELRSPLVIKDLSPSLDGVIYSVLESHLPEATISERFAMMDKLLTRHESGVYHASSMRLGVSTAFENGKDLSRGVTIAKYVRSDSMERLKLKSTFYASFGLQKSKPYPKVYTSGGPYKNRLTERDAYAAPFVVFDGLGDGRRIYQLLKYYLMGVGYDANNANAGAIGHIDLVPLKKDVSLILPNGSANRCLPTELAKSLNATGLDSINRIKPPYYHGKKVPVVVPERIRIITNIDAFKS